MTTSDPDAAARPAAHNDHLSQITPYPAADFWATLARAFVWVNMALLTVFLVNNFANNIFGLGGARAALGWSDVEATAIDWIQLLAYPALVVAALFLVARNPRRALRADSEILTNANLYFIRAFFWAVLFVGLGDFAISFLRTEGFIELWFGEEAHNSFLRPQFRGLYFHVPLLLLGFVVAVFTRTLGFHWLTLLVVIAELGIVIGRFVFSYEQAFMADLVRYWYAALFLFASAYTLLEDGHVRVDVFYAALKLRTKGRLNAIGCVVLGMGLTWAIIIIGMGGQGSAINSPMFNFERGQQADGLFIKYQLAAFIGIFAISMLVQFCAYFLESVADAREEPGKRQRESAGSAH